MGTMKKILFTGLLALVLLNALWVTAMAQPDAEPDIPTLPLWTENVGVTEPTETTIPTESQTTITTSTTAAHTATTTAKTENPPAEDPLPVRGIVIYSLIALLIMVGVGVAIYILTTHQFNDQPTSSKH